MTESANNTSITPSIITDNANNVWGLAPSQTKGSQIVRNGAIQTSTSNVMLLLYYNHSVFHQNASNSWYLYRNGTWIASTDPRLVESPQGTAVTTIGPAIINSFFESWTMVNDPASTRGVQVACNGVTDTITGSVVSLLYYNHLVYQTNTVGSWYSKSRSSDAWTQTTDPRLAATPTITGINLSSSSFTGGSPSGTVVGAITVMMSGGTWSGTLSLSGTSASSFQIVGSNLVTVGVLAPANYSVNVVATQTGATGSPYTQQFPITGTAGATAPTIASINLSNSSFAGNSPSGTVVGGIQLVVNNGPFSGTLSLSGANASSFQISGSNLVTSGVVGAGSYVINIVATQAGATNSPFTQQFSITGTSVSGGAWWTTPPPQAAAAGFKTLKFSDDFTSASTITFTNSASQRNYTWYPASWGGPLSTTQIQVNGSWTAGDSNMKAQGVTSAGPNASPSGGIVRLQGGASNATIMSVDGQITTMPTSGTFQHYYAEVYMQYKPSTVSTNSQTAGWPGWWSWSMENMRGLGFGGSPFGGNYTEIDFWEYANFATGGHWGGMGFHGSMSGGVGLNTPGISGKVDNEWHTIGCLWTPKAVTFYYDDVQVGGSFTPSAALETEHQFIMLGSGLIQKPTSATEPVPIYVDWCRCWTA